MRTASVTDRARDLVEQKLQEIAACVLDVPDSSTTKDNLGLFNGKAGEALFLMYYARYSGDDRYYQAAIRRLEEALEGVNSGFYLHTHCSGIAGICWGIGHLAANDFIEADLDETLGEFDDFLAQKMLEDIERGVFDFLHGALGVAFYFLLRRDTNPAVDRHLLKLLDGLRACAIAGDGPTLKWVTIIDGETFEKGPNISLSHGMSAIAAMLSKFIRKGISPESSAQLLEPAVNYILRQEMPPEYPVCRFPSYSRETNQGQASRLGWCYGDMGIGMALLQAGRTLSRQDWTDKGIEALAHACTRTDPAQGAINDAGLCHGSAGVAHMFSRAFQETGVPGFRDTAKLWYDKTLDFAHFPDGLAGYKTFKALSHGGPYPCSELLNGVSGVGMALLHTLSDLPPDWDECLLLS